MDRRRRSNNMDIHFLGTGAGMPSKLRNTSAVVLDFSAEGRGYWLFDCGEATQHQILHTSLKPRKIEKIFISHLHGDHIFGLPGLISSRSFLGGEHVEPLHIYGPVGLSKWLQETLQLTNTHLTYVLHVYEIAEGLVFEDEQFMVYVDQLEHVIPSFGFRIEQKPLPGKLLIDRVRALGVPKGPLLKQLKDGDDITLDDGQIVYSKDVTGDPQPGFVITVLGDTTLCDASIGLAKNADVLIHEATFNAETGAIAKDYGHSTIQDAAYVAKEAKVQTLIANHISARFLPYELDAFKQEGEEVFSPIYIANDFDRFELKHRRLTKLMDN